LTKHKYFVTIVVMNDIGKGPEQPTFHEIFSAPDPTEAWESEDQTGLERIIDENRDKASRALAESAGDFRIPGIAEKPALPLDIATETDPGITK
jgi:hypothetical protein